MKNIFIILVIAYSLFEAHVVAANQPLIANSKIEPLLIEGSEYQRSGYYLDAQKAYHTALLQAEKQQDKTGRALAKSALGYIAYLLYHPEQAAPLLEQALVLARESHHSDLVAVTQYYSGLTAQSLNQPDQAQTFLKNALSSATQSNNLELMARCHLALAQMASNLDEFKTHQQNALTSIDALTNQALAGELRLIVAEQWLNHPLLPTITPANGSKENRLVILYKQLTLAYSQIPAGNHHSIAKYYGLLGHVYESQQRHQEALALTQRALEHLQTINAGDLEVFYNWQAARLHTALQQRDAAIASYRRAISAVQAIRQDIPVFYENGKSSFLELFGPLYRSAVAALTQSPKAGVTAVENPQLAEVLGIMEQLKQTELEDFFKNRCLLTDFQGNPTKLQNNKTAIFYPVMLPDRIELILSIGNRLYQRTINLKSETLDEQVRRFASQLRYGENYQQAARQFYGWLINPLEQFLTANSIDTLIYVPDDSLRLLPLAALHDGQHYLIERYAIVTVPSMALIAPTTKQSNHNTLLAGMSEPSLDLVAQLSDKLPNLQGDFAASRGLSGEVNRIGLRSATTKLRELDVRPSAKDRSANLQTIARSLALPGVKTEIDSLAVKLPNQILFNRDYTLHNFERAAKQAEYGALHIASHGFFGNKSEDSFILTYDKLLGIDHLETLLTERGQPNTLDLLVLSACQTAEGDDRAPLGLAGIALKAKANNALGTLWPINDKATVEIMLQFYDGITNQGLTKAKALQRAQITLIKSKAMANPFFWAPFILAGNGI